MSHAAWQMPAIPGRPGRQQAFPRPCHPRPDGGGAHETLAAIQQAIELTVIPRLVELHGNRPAVPPTAADPAEAEALANGLLGPDPAGTVARHAETFARPGTEAAGLALLAGAARHLGTLWEADEASFTAVTLATMHLADLLRALVAANPVAAPGQRDATAILMQVPGEQHTLGLSMLAHCLRRDGWRVLLPRVDGTAALRALLAGTPADMVGFSMAADVHLSRLARCVAAARQARPGPGLIVMVGGPAFLQRPELGTVVGACATARSGEEAVAVAAALLERRRSTGTVPGRTGEGSSQTR